MLLSLLVACLPFDSDSDSDAPPPTAAVMVGPAGGQIDVDGVVLDIPAGALEDSVEIRIVDTGEAPPPPYVGLSTVWSFEPDGLVFAAPVEVQIPYDASAPVPRFFWSDDAGGYTALDATFADGMATASIEHFSTGFVAVAPTETIGFDTYYPGADVLFVVDNSCSMSEEQSQLATNIPSMFAALQDSGLDFHIGVVSTDTQDMSQAGLLRVVNGVRFIEPSTPNPQAVFSYMANLGTGGFYDEKGRAAAYTTLEVNRLRPRNVDFYREEATLDVIFLSDEEDQSGPNPITGPDFVTWMDALKVDPDDSAAHAIVGLPGQPCNATDTPGTQYLQAANATGGEIANLCDADWSPLLDTVVDVRLQGARVELPVVPAAVVEVAFDVAGAPRLVLDPSEYTVDGAIVRFDQGVRPEAGDTVRVDYQE